MVMRSRDNQQEDDAPAGVPSSELCLHSQGCEMQVSAMTPTARGSPLPSEHPNTFSHIGILLPDAQCQDLFHYLFCTVILQEYIVTHIKII